MNKTLSGIGALLVLAGAAQAAPTVSAIFSDHMVLQRGTHVPVWGKADAGEKIAVVLGAGGAQGQATADASGNWRVVLDTSKASAEPTELTVSGTATIKISDVLVGQVWLCSGQSNMAWVVRDSANAAAEAKAADFPQIRQFAVADKTAFNPTTELKGQWVVASPQTVPGFTAAGYFFGRELHQQLKTPVGLINSSVGGTAAEMWASDESLQPLADFDVQRDMMKQMGAGRETARVHYNSELAKWAAKLPVNAEEKLARQYADPAFDSSSWKSLNMPQSIEKTDPDFDGSIWYRRDFTLDSADGEATLSLGRIDDNDVTYINGVKVGSMGLENAGAWATPRRYKIAPGVLKAGRNVIAVRVFDIWLAGGFTGSPDELGLQVGGKHVSLAGPWQSAVEHALTPQEKAIAAQRPTDPDQSVNVPSMLYNGMIYPLQPYAIAGAIWYQGEANANRDEQYGRLLPAMIEGWRSAWKQEGKSVIHGEAGRDFPFYIVQIANFMEYRRDPNFYSSWAPIREVQTLTARTIANSGLAVTIDIGDERNIHPQNKQDVGKRLAAVALKNAYGKDIVCDGPEFQKMRVEAGHVFATFAHTDGGLLARELSLSGAGNGPSVYKELVQADTQIKGFAIRGEDGKWAWAKAKIVDASTVEIWSDQVTKPVAISYGWADNPVVNLCNGAGFPAVPFRSAK